MSYKIKAEQKGNICGTKR